MSSLDGVKAITKKRKRTADSDSLDTPHQQIGSDERFQFSAEDLADDDAAQQLDSDNDNDNSHNQPTPSTSSFNGLKTTLPAHLLPSSHSNKNKTTPGLVYLSRIPPGMGPPKVKHLLSAYGEVGRIYLNRADKDQSTSTSLKGKKRQREKHQEHKFSEGWVEFLDKRVARSVAEMLNANTIGGKKGSRWRDDVWTMKYLPRFRWDMLSEQVALERATQDSVMRFHLQQSKKEQESYLSAVEQARVSRKIEEKRAMQQQAKQNGTTTGNNDVVSKKPKVDEGGGKTQRTYKQREVVKTRAPQDKTAGRGGTKQDLDNVLGRLF
ncbi:RNA-binding ATPase activator esf2 [Microbotryomycetes sp. JL221]|nr:RNA-binding ATPase activator esf2 [Microbotryomycetes sp. JL221]